MSRRLFDRRNDCCLLSRCDDVILAYLKDIDCCLLGSLKKYQISIFHTFFWSLLALSTSHFNIAFQCYHGCRQRSSITSLSTCQLQAALQASLRPAKGCIASSLQTARESIAPLSKVVSHRSRHLRYGGTLRRFLPHARERWIGVQ
jgi:hypothetical protein